MSFSWSKQVAKQNYAGSIWRLFSALLLLSLSTSSWGLALYQKPKNWDQRNFMLSLLPDTPQLTLVPIANINGLPAGIPYLGHYRTPYFVRELLGLMQLPVELLRERGPAEIQAQLAPVAGPTNFYVIIWGPMLDELAPTAHNNVIFHPVAVQWTGQPRPDINLQGGLFLPQNVVPAAAATISFGGLQQLNVNVHPAEGGGDACSPDNARFNVVAGAPAASFWLVGRYHQQAVVTYNLILNSAELLDAVRAVGWAAPNLGEFIDQLRTVAGGNAVIRDFIATLERLLGGSYAELLVANAAAGKHVEGGTGGVAEHKGDTWLVDDDLTTEERDLITALELSTMASESDWGPADEKSRPGEWEELTDKDVASYEGQAGGGGGDSMPGAASLVLDAAAAVTVEEELLATVGQSTKDFASDLAAYQTRGEAILATDELAQRVGATQGVYADSYQILKNGVKAAKTWLINSFTRLSPRQPERAAIKAYLQVIGVFG